MGKSRHWSTNMELSVLLLFPLLVSCGPLPDLSPKICLNPSLSTSVTLSAHDLYSTVERQEVGERNVLISPLSIQLAASLVYNGARGDSKHQLATMLGLHNVSDHLVQQETRKLLLSYAELKKNLTANIELANVIFADESAEVKDTYEDVLNESFLTSTQRLNYSDTVESAEIINSWVADKTNNLINDLVSPTSFSPTTRMMLLNAVYFKANWQLPFQKALTRTGDFFVSKDRFVDADMMFLDDSIYYGHDKDLESQIISLQYEDPNFTMIIMLPDSESGLKTLSQKLKGKNLTQIHNSPNPREMILFLPKFKTGYKTELVSAFRSLGVSDIFAADSADLSGITPEPVFISDIIHQTKVEVNEEGSEAAAVTGVQIDIRSGHGHSPHIVLYINGPFFFVIQDLKNNIPLFMGKIVNPTDQDPVLVVNDKKEVVEHGSLVSLNLIPEVKTEKENFVSIRSSNPEDLLDNKEMDPEEKAHIKNFPGYEVPDCHEVSGDNDHILFPCPMDTQPIEDYKKEHGDPSRLGINGEKAALLIER